MTKTIALWACTLLVVFAAHGRAQTASKYCCEGYAFFGRRTATAGPYVGGVGGDIFIYKGLAVGGDVGTTLGNPDNKITIGSGDVSYHFASRNARHKVEPFIATGWSYLAGNIKTAIEYPFSSGQDRTGPNLSAGLAFWPTKRVGTRFEVRDYRFFVSYGALEDVIPGGHFVEFRIAFTVR
jgi:hypothetical protein